MDILNKLLELPQPHTYISIGLFSASLLYLAHIMGFFTRKNHFDVNGKVCQPLISPLNAIS
jgi:hypothetical protein